MTNGMQALAAAGLAAAMVSGTALAQERGLYVGGTAGGSEVRHSCPSGADCDHDGTAYRLFGGYQYNPYFSVEFGYAKLSDLVVEGAGEAKPKAGDISAIASWPVAERLSILGRLGVYRSQLELHFEDGGSVSEHNSAWTYGLGVNILFGRHLRVRAEWQHYKAVGGPDTGEDNINFASAGLVWLF